jgi:excinuclease ABC subunit C
MVSLKKNDQDVIGFYQVGKHVEVTVLFVRAGRLLGKKSFGLSIPGGQLSPSKGNLSSPKGKLSSPKGKLSSPKGKLSSPKGKLSSPGLTGGSIPPFLDSFLNQYYDQEFVPDEVITSVDPEGKKLLEAYLKEKKKSAVKITVAKKGEKKSLVDMAIENAKETIRGKNLELKGADVLEALAAKLHLENDPHRIECYDISNIQGNQAVGSRVTFIEGEEDKSLYRKYKIKTVEGPNDFAMMYEVLSRRFRGKAKDTLPDLLMIDGGKGQLSIALRVLKELEIENMDVIGLAKEKVHASFKGKLIEKKQERVYKPGQKNPIVLKENTPVLHLLQRVRDEAHRFAITYHKKLRAKEFIPK